MTEVTAGASAASYKINSLSVSEVWGKAWAFFKDHLVDLIIFALVYFVASQVPSFIVNQLFGEGSVIGSLLGLALGIWNAYLALGSMKYILAMIRGKKPNLADIFNNTEVFLPFLIVYVVFGFAVLFGLVLLVVPGVIISLMYGFSTMLVADGKAKGMDAFSMSAKMTEGRRMEIFVYWLASVALIIVGFIALIIPGIIASFIVGLGSFLMYEYLVSSVPSTK